MSIISVGATGAVQPNEDQEVAVRQILKGMDPLLDIKWFPHAVGSEGRYALVCRWPQADRRWELHQSGEIGGEPIDILGWFVEPDDHGGLHNGTGVPVEPMLLMDKICEWLGAMDNSRQPWRDRMLKAVEHNRREEKKKAASIVDETMDQTAYYTKKFFGEGIHRVGIDLRGDNPQKEE